MAFNKTGIAVDTRILSDREARDLTQPRSNPPPNPEVGDMWEGMVWDGGAWVTLESWQARQARGG